MHNFLPLSVTENTCLLQHMVEASKKLSFTNGIGDSPLHSIINMPRPTETDLFLEVVKILIRYGVSPDIRNREGRSAIDCVNRTREPKTFLLLTTCKEFNQGNFYIQSFSFPDSLCRWFILSTFNMYLHVHMSFRIACKRSVLKPRSRKT